MPQSSNDDAGDRFPGAAETARAPRFRGIAGAGMLALALSLAGLSPGRAQDTTPRPVPAEDVNFSQYPGFETYLRDNPPATAPASAAEQALLQRFRPHLYLADGQEPPLDFYADYIAHGRLLDGDGLVLSDRVDQALLNQVKLRPRVNFVHEPSDSPISTTLYGRLDRIARPRAMTFLTYHAAFRRSGLPAGVPGWQATLLSAIASLDDWHQLDHYTAVSVVLDADDEPFAVMLQQHNYQRTHLVGEELVWPDDDRIGVDIAIRSNELYLHAPGRRQHKAVRFLTPEALAYLTDFGPAPFPSADDVTDPAREVDYALAFLAPSDAFYTFRGFLGARRLLPGRDGPPGAFYNTLPKLKPLPLQLGIGYWRAGSQQDRARALEAQRSGEDWHAGFAGAQLEALLANSECLRRVVLACASD